MRTKEKNYISHFIDERSQMEFEKDHPYMKRLDETLKQYSVVKVADGNGAHHGEDYEEMKQAILDALFMRYAGETIRK